MEEAVDGIMSLGLAVARELSFGTAVLALGLSFVSVVGPVIFGVLSER